MIDTGQVYHATLTVRDLTGALVNAATCVLTITRPDGSTSTPAVTNSGTGQYYADYTTAAPGLHKAAWVTTVPGTAATDWFNVRQFVSILSLAEAKAHLTAGTGATNWTGDDDELRNFLAATTEVIEAKAGPCARRTVTQLTGADETAMQIALNQFPVISVASVASTWPGGPSWTTAQLDVDTDAGLVNLAPPMVMPFFLGPWIVTYDVGRAIVPERLIHAGKELLRHLWDTQRGQLAAPVLGGGEQFVTSSGMSFSVPLRVLEMLADDMTPAI